jgi:hypothetical protein
MSVNKTIAQAFSILYTSGVASEIQSYKNMWQSVEVDDPMLEVCNMFFDIKMPENKKELIKECRPDLPWAEDHFQERVGGKPLNPGDQYYNWPYYDHSQDDDRFREGHFKGQFSHSYMERYWPPRDLKGIRYNYGDLHHLVQRLNKNPLTRQAYFAVWYPEDQVERGERVPCSLGYHFLIRQNKINVTYHIRSCDIRRHFHNDIYLTMRLAQWVRDKLKTHFEMGNLYMWIGSLHCFSTEKSMLLKEADRWNKK